MLTTKSACGSSKLMGGSVSLDPLRRLGAVTGRVVKSCR